MEIYYCNQIKRKTGVTAAWSQAPGYAPQLAVSLAPNAVGFYTEEVRMSALKLDLMPKTQLSAHVLPESMHKVP
eukprot:1161913-Pelagomonas_calceolata.AAC.1